MGLSRPRQHIFKVKGTDTEDFQGLGVYVKGKDPIEIEIGVNGLTIFNFFHFFLDKWLPKLYTDKALGMWRAG